jgi:uncharacterized protein (TIGR02186 family)
VNARAALLALCLAALCALGPGRAGAQELVADLSDHLIAIDSEFTGTDLLVFGAIEGEGDIVVLVRGPRSSVVVREKARVFGIWLNASSVTFDNVPSFYALATSRPPEEMLDADMRRLNEIGLDQLRLEPEPGTDIADIADFRDALVHLRQKIGLYSSEPGKVSFLGPRLFRTAIHFPAAVPVGRYTVDVILVRDGQVVQSFSPPLTVDKAGLGADIFDFAHNDAALYGLLAVIGAAIAGFLGSLLFRRP